MLLAIWLVGDDRVGQEVIGQQTKTLIGLYIVYVDTGDVLISLPTVCGRSLVVYVVYVVDTGEFPRDSPMTHTLSVFKTRDFFYVETYGTHKYPHSHAHSH